jgi:hypothetical protein
MEYKTYKIENMELEKNQKIVEFDNGIYKAFLVCKIPYSKDINLAHIGFHAVNNYWKSFTETGYKSIFFYYDNLQDFKDDKSVIDYFLEYLDYHKFVFEKEMQQSIF